MDSMKMKEKPTSIEAKNFGDFRCDERRRVSDVVERLAQ